MNKTPRRQRARTHFEWNADRRLVLVPGDPTRAQIVVGWIVWHSREVAGVLAPAGVAVAVTPWAWLVSGAVTAGWTVYEVRQAREQAAIKAGRDLPAAVVDDIVDDIPAGSDVDTTVAGVDATTSVIAADAPAGAGVEVWL